MYRKVIITGWVLLLVLFLSDSTIQAQSGRDELPEPEIKLDHTALDTVKIKERYIKIKEVPRIVYRHNFLIYVFGVTTLLLLATSVHLYRKPRAVLKPEEEPKPRRKPRTEEQEQTANIQQIKQELESKLYNRLVKLSSILVQVRELFLTSKIDRIISNIAKILQGALGAEKFALIWKDKMTETLKIVKSNGYEPEKIKKAEIEINLDPENLVNHIMNTGEVFDPVKLGEQFNREYLAKQPLTPMVCGPLKSDGQVVGVINVETVEGEKLSNQEFILFQNLLTLIETILTRSGVKSISVDELEAARKETEREREFI